MILTVTPNPAWDVTYHVDQLHPGESHRVTSWAGHAGGKGINTARICLALGRDVHAIAPVGGLFAPVFEAELKRAGLPVTIVETGMEMRQSVAVLPDQPTRMDDGHPSVFNEAGPTFTTEQWDAVIEAAATKAKEADVATISGSIPPGVGRDGFDKLLRALLDAGCVTMVDAWGPTVMWAAEAGVSLIKPNKSELHAATGVEDIAVGAQKVLAAGAGAVVVTDGDKGMSAYVAGREGPVCTAVMPNPVYGNPTGAGDAALAALACTVGQEWPDRLKYAVAVSAASVMRPFAGEVIERDVNGLLPLVQLR